MNTNRYIGIILMMLALGLSIAHPEGAERILTSGVISAAIQEVAVLLGFGIKKL